jgi:fructose-bisphosphate aldolase class II
VTVFTELLGTAADAKRGVGAFNVVLLEHAEAIVAGAEHAHAPVILQISENCISYHGGVTPITVASLAIAASSPALVLVHLDHIEDPELVRRGVDLGVASVMFDASRLDYADNVKLTRELADFFHANGVSIEAELGEVGGKDGVLAPGARTIPSEAAAFVAETGVDALAVAVGTSHAMQSRTGAVDHDLIAQLREAVPIPLVLHGSSGLPDAELQNAVRSGMTKINISTHLNGMFTLAVREVLAMSPELSDPRKYIGPGRTAIREEATRLLDVISGAPAT